jgi:hypothetical protein
MWEAEASGHYNACTTSPRTMTTPSRSSPTRILLLGAGELGLALLSHLTTLPWADITIGVRSPEKHAHLASPTVALQRLDLTAPSNTLIPLLNTYSIIVSATGFTSTPGSVTKLAAEVLAAGQLRQTRGEGELWFFPWQWGVDYDVTGDGEGLMPLFGEQKRVRDLLREEASGKGVRWTVVSTGIFMSFLFEAAWGVVDREKEIDGEVVVRCLRDWEHRVTVTDVNDIGRVMERIVKRDTESKDSVVYVAGDSISYGELADVVEKVVQCRVRRETWSIPYLQEELEKDPENGIKKYRLVFAREGVWWEKERTVNHELGMLMMDVETYARKVFDVQK